MNLFGSIIEKRANIEKTEKSAIESDSPLNAKICIMSATVISRRLPAQQITHSGLFLS